MPRFLRFRQKGCRVLELDIDIIKVLQIECCEDGDYVLLAFSTTQAYHLCYGNFDECHFMLNQLHDTLGIEIIDL